jgi:hypothetical protein
MLSYVSICIDKPNQATRDVLVHYRTCRIGKEPLAANCDLFYENECVVHWDRTSVVHFSQNEKKDNEERASEEVEVFSFLIGSKRSGACQFDALV